MNRVNLWPLAKARTDREDSSRGRWNHLMSQDKHRYVNNGRRVTGTAEEDVLALSRSLFPEKTARLAPVFFGGERNTEIKLCWFPFFLRSTAGPRR